jgi:NADH-quinone oxidoreductase subunit L
MVMALSAGGYFAGVFHLTTHAGFKALLFLCSGIFIHEFHTNDMREIGKAGGRKLVIPLICMTVGATALSGLFPFSGFFSKEAILGVLATHSNPIWLAAGLTGALMTAYYSFRLIFFILFPKGGVVEHHHEDAGGHVEHESEHHGLNYWSMIIPVMILATVTLVLGFFQSSLEHFLTAGAAPHPMPAAHEGEHGIGHLTLLVAAVGLALSGVAWAYLEFGRKGAAQKGFLSYVPPIQELFGRRWFLDDFYRKFLDRVVYGGLTNLFTRNDRRIIDGGIDGLCFFTVASGRLSSFLQSGMLQYNLLVMIGAVGLVLLYFLL